MTKLIILYCDIFILLNQKNESWGYVITDFTRIIRTLANIIDEAFLEIINGLNIFAKREMLDFNKLLSTPKWFMVLYLTLKHFKVLLKKST